MFLWDKRLVVSVFLLGCVFSSGWGFKWRSLFDDEEIVEMEDLNRGIEGITGWLAGKDKTTGEKKELLFGDPSEKKDYTVKDMKDVSIHCAAPFPVTLDHEGSPMFKFHNTGSGSSSSMYKNDTHEIDVEKHTMFAHLPPDCSVCTGTFICKGTGEGEHDKKHKTVQAHLSFSTERLFVFSRTWMISSAEIPFIIPCAVGEPKAAVTLLKVDIRNSPTVVRPVSFEKYDPREGFTLTKSEGNSEGTFFCVARHGSNHRVLEYQVIQGKVNCTKPCSENSQCEKVGKTEEEICQCKLGYMETLVSEKCLKPCRNDMGCDEEQACLPQNTDSFLLDILTLPEGRKGEEGEEDDNPHQKRGVCHNPCVYTNAKCGGDRECHVANHKPVCGPPRK